MTRTMRLSDLLPDVPDVPPSLAITGLVQDSRAIAPGNAFVAIGGFGTHGLHFVEQAKSASAAVILFEPPVPAGVPVPSDDAIAVPGLRARMGAMADAFHGRPSHAMRMVGVTGTSGKTSTVQLLAQAWTLLGTRSGTIGTLGAGLYGEAVATGFTTPLVLQMHALLAELRDAGARAVAMEVSSHALDQGRVDAVHYDVAVFTNLTRDHLDYHGDMERYGAAKSLLFAREGLSAAVINIDDAYGRALAARLSAPSLSPKAKGRAGEGSSAAEPAPDLIRGASAVAGDRQGATANAPLPNPPLLAARAREGVKLIGISARGDASADVCAHDVMLDASGIGFDLSLGDAATMPVRSPLLGRFNVDNLLAVAAVLHAQDHTPQVIADTLSRLQPIPGRMNRLGGDGVLPLLVIDYSHKPDPLEQALVSLRGHVRGRLLCVFGCGGERDRGKRPQMAAIAEANADAVIVTDDNPRGEDGDAIVAGIMAGFVRPQAVVVERDRRKAIVRAVGEAGPDDIVLVAGKGHEPYQEVDGVKHPFDDSVVARQALEGRA